MNNIWFSSPSVVNIELTNKCNKNPGCFMCGRRQLEKDYPELADFTKDMTLELVYKILDQLPPGIVVQFHNNGEPTLYPYLKEVLSYRTDIIRCFNTNGKLLLEKANDLINNMESLTISVIENDPEGDKQFQIVKEFLEIKGDKKPYIVFRLLGNVGLTPFEDKSGWFIDKKRQERWYNLAKKYNCLIATRILHKPEGSFGYTKKVTIPEIGCCLDLLSHLAVNVEGKVSICVRFDPKGYGIIGDINKESLFNIWNSKKRKYYIQEHLKGNRGCNELCKACHFYGVPTS